jgi:hypothetical protein
MANRLSLFQCSVMADRLYSNIKYVGDCWIWQGRVNAEGYGRIRVPHEESKWAVHRLSYVIAHGHLSDDLTIDHLCRTPSCINPEHLEAVTMETNIRRGFGIGMRNAAKLECVNGHPYVDGSYILEQIGNGKQARRCIICRRKRENKNYHAKRAEGRSWQEVVGSRYRGGR